MGPPYFDLADLVKMLWKPFYFHSVSSKVHNTHRRLKIEGVSSNLAHFSLSISGYSLNRIFFIESKISCVTEVWFFLNKIFENWAWLCFSEKWARLEDSLPIFSLWCELCTLAILDIQSLNSLDYRNYKIFELEDNCPLWTITHYSV